MSVEKKSEILAAILSAIFPGVGQIYNGRMMKGLVFIVIGIICAALGFVVIGFILYPLFWLYNILDAYRGAQAINRHVIEFEAMRRAQSGPTHNQATIKETIIQKEIVKIPCQYCKHLVDVTADKCPNCGANPR
jgi:TM2 domain-containing membrane protein YozV